MGNEKCNRSASADHALDQKFTSENRSTQEGEANRRGRGQPSANEEASHKHVAFDSFSAGVLRACLYVRVHTARCIAREKRRQKKMQKKMQKKRQQKRQKKSALSAELDGDRVVALVDDACARHAVFTHV